MNARKQRLLLIGAATSAALLAGALSSKKKPTSKSQESSRKSNKTLERAAKLADPVAAEPSTALESLAMLESFSPSLMRRDSKMQGIMTGASVLSARGVSHVNEKVTRTIAGYNAGYWRKVATRMGIIGASEYVAASLRKYPRSNATDAARSAARVTSISSMSGLVYDASEKLSENRSSGNRQLIRASAIGAALSLAVMLRGKSLLQHRQDAIQSGPGDPANRILPAIASAFAAIGVGRSIAWSYKKSGQQIHRWLGSGVSKKPVANAINLSAWAGAATGIYYAGLAYIGKSNEMIEDGYSKQPTTANVSGSKQSHVAFDRLGAQGRRFVSETLGPQYINKILGIRSAKQPVRTYVGYNSTSLFPSARAELALAELERTNAFSKKYLLLVSPTGTGWIDQTMIESVELLTKGDVATCAIQYARFPSFLSLQKVALGRRQFQQLLWGVKLKLERMPAKERPKLLIFGESLGAWTSSDTIMHLGIEGFDYYGVDKALWVGMPKLAKWSTLEDELRKDRKYAGAMGVFDNATQLQELTPTKRAKLKATILNHDNDPIAKAHPNMIYRQPDWLQDGQTNRGRGIPDGAEWHPITSFLQTGIDAGNAMRVVPGKFRSHGHDYRADMADFVYLAYGLNATKLQLERVKQALIDLEIERANRSSSES